MAGGDSGQTPPAPGGFAAPGELVKTSQGYGDATLGGGNYNVDWPHAGVRRGNYHDYFYAEYRALESETTSFAGMAYAIYEMNIKGIDNATAIDLTWDYEPDATDLWIALSDWQHSCWRWFTTDNVDCLTEANLQDYADSDGRMLVVIAVGRLPISTLLQLNIADSDLYSVSGYVRSVTGEGLAGVSISLNDGLGTTSTDDAGFWTFTGLANGEYTATPQLEGYWLVPYCQPFEIYRSDKLAVDFTQVKVGQSDWSMFGRDARHSGCSPDLGPANASIKWIAETDSFFQGSTSPAIGSDGSIYVGMWKRVVALNRDGTIRWEFATGYDVSSSPAIGRDGTIYASCEDGNLYAINPDGSLSWTFAIGKCDVNLVSSPSIGPDNTIYVGSYVNHCLYAIHPDGTLAWSFATGDCIDSSPAISEDGTIYIGSYDEKLYALSPSGHLIWSFYTDGPVISSPAIGSDGTIYVGSLNCTFYAIKPSGTMKWRVYTSSTIFIASPAIGPDGSVYIGSLDSNLYALTPNGGLKWVYALGDIVTGTPVVDAAGTVFITNESGTLYALNPEGGLNWSFEMGGYADTLTGAIGEDGTLYMPGGSGQIFAFGNPAN